jgi:transcriptional regulator with XRE-family HTH domain
VWHAPIWKWHNSLGTLIKELFVGQVRRLRTEADLSQEALAGKCNIFRTYLSRIENGTGNPTIAVVAALAAALKVEVGELFKD